MKKLKTLLIAVAIVLCLAVVGGTAFAEEIDVGGPYPATTDWDEYSVTEYYFAETDETVDMLVETNSDHNKFAVLFDFFGDKQEMRFSVNGDALTVDYDLTGFIGKDVKAIYAFIQEKVTEWKPIGEEKVKEVDVGGPYPATTDWDEYLVAEYYFAETDENVDMLIETNSAHDKFAVLFDFFGDKQEMRFSVNGDALTVDYDLTGFIGKDVKAIYAFIQEQKDGFKPIPKGEVKEVEVGGPYPATTDWDEYAVAEYYFAETDEDVDMLIETNSAHDKFAVLFNFFGDKQEMRFSVNGDALTVDYDLTGFIGKDVKAIYAFIQENVTDWAKIG